MCCTPKQELSEGVIDTCRHDADTVEGVRDLVGKLDRDALPLGYRAGLHAISHCAISLVPLYIICQALMELGCECPSEYESKIAHARDGQYRILIFERSSIAGLGLAKQACVKIPELLSEAMQIIEKCDCDIIQGCASCVQGNCGEHGTVSDKRSALLILKALLALPVS